MIRHEFERTQPELCMLGIAPDVDVHRFAAVETVKEEAIRSRNPTNARHTGINSADDDAIVLWT
jgi:hypothetical protein